MSQGRKRLCESFRTWGLGQHLIPVPVPTAQHPGRLDQPDQELRQRAIEVRPRGIQPEDRVDRDIPGGLVWRDEALLATRVTNWDPTVGDQVNAGNSVPDGADLVASILRS